MSKGNVVKIPSQESLLRTNRHRRGGDYTHSAAANTMGGFTKEAIAPDAEIRVQGTRGQTAVRTLPLASWQSGIILVDSGNISRKESRLLSAAIPKIKSRAREPGTRWRSAATVASFNRIVGVARSGSASPSSAMRDTKRENWFETQKEFERSLKQIKTARCRFLSTPVPRHIGHKYDDLALKFYTAALNSQD